MKNVWAILNVDKELYMVKWFHNNLVEQSVRIFIVITISCAIEINDWKCNEKTFVSYDV